MTPSAARARRAFFAAAAITLAFRLWLAWALPITGDEAYFAYWGEVPAAGYYDHPPMVGWILAALLPVSHAEWWIRLPQVLLPLGIAALMVPLARPAGETAAWLTATAFLVAPVQVLNVAITTDTPLVAFSFLSMAAFVVAIRRDSLRWAAIAGLALGFAILSKFFAALVAIAYVAYALLPGGWPRRWQALGVVALVALPFGLYLVWWNYEHCWANVMFNIYIRHGDAGFAWSKPLKYAGFFLYATSPVLVWLIVRHYPAVRRSATGAVRFLWIAAVAPLAVFGALSLVKSIGLHWLFAFVPPLFVASAYALGERALRANAIFLAVFSALHAVAAIVALALPVETYAKLRQYDGIVMTVRTDDLLAQLKPYEGEYVLAADGYSPAVTLGYAARRLGLATAPQEAGLPPGYFPVFGPASPRARQDDIVTDFRKLDRRNILIVRKTPADDAQYRPYFESVEYRDVDVHGARYQLVLGRGFDYAAYRDRALAAVRDQYYRIPAYLPQGRCWLCERYFGTATCPTR